MRPEDVAVSINLLVGYGKRTSLCPASINSTASRDNFTARSSIFESTISDTTVESQECGVPVLLSASS